MTPMKPLPLLNRALRGRCYTNGFASKSGQSLSHVARRWPIYSPPALAQHAPPCRAELPLMANGFQKSTISTTVPKSVFGWVQDKLAERAQTKKAAKIVDQIALMANSPTWTIKMFAAEIDETLSSWTTKIPGASKSTELQAAKESQKVVNAIREQLGDNVTAKDVSKFDRKQKLKLAIACKKPMDELDVVLNSFTQMDIMHRILMYRKENGISLPEDDAGLKMAMEQDGMRVMTKEEKNKMREIYEKHMESQKA